jgi:ABC-type uncharacterized transport system involved in gliding motility auxiliary subunit
MKSLKNIILTHKTPILWSASGVLLVAMLFARAIFPEILWLTIAIVLPLIAVLTLLVLENRAALRGRTAAFGLNTIVTSVLVIAIVGVLNFMASRYPAKLDLTSNKRHTLSDQTTKLIKGLQKPVKAVLFNKVGQAQSAKPLLDNLRGLNPKFEVEYVDPDKETARARQVGVKKYNTLQLTVGTRESKIEDPDEEKITNALIKLMKEKAPTLCSLTDHGEKKFTSTDADGYDAARKTLEGQSYTVKEISLLQENKIPDDCDGLMIIGAQKSFFAPEITAIRDYLANGGRAIVAVDINIKGGEFAPELLALLQEWNVKAVPALIVDPLSRMLGVDAAVPVLASFSKDNPITKDFQASCYFPFTRPLEIIPGAPASLNAQWLAQTTPKSWAESNFKELTSGQVQYTEGSDKMGPVNAVVAVSGKQKDSKATKNTRLVVFGSSNFATNNYSRFGGNLDFFVNATSWVLEDENLISIRAKEEAGSKVELTQKQGMFIFLLTVVIIPLIVAVGGIVIWVLRRRL